MADITLRSEIAAVTHRIARRSAKRRRRYVDRIRSAVDLKPRRSEIFNPLRACLSRADEGASILGTLAG